MLFYGGIEDVFLSGNVTHKYCRKKDCKTKGGDDDLSFLGIGDICTSTV